MTRARRAGAIGASLAILAHFAVTAAAPACQTHNCDPDFVCIDSSGRMVAVAAVSDCTAATVGTTPIAGYDTMDIYMSAQPGGGSVTTWATSKDSTGPWLDYPGQRTYIINYPASLSTQDPFFELAYVSADNPTDAGTPHANFIAGSDYLAEFSTKPGQLTVVNPTCAHYSLRVVVEFSASAGDASTE
jgi:hypothetical protein